MQQRYNSGDTIGRWTLEGDEPLGKGGNGEVWRARMPSSGLIALKIVHRAGDSEPYRRFRAEIDVLQNISEIPGVLPLFDHHLPTNPTKKDPAWLAMPIAIPLKSRFSLDVSAETIVKAIAEIAETLAALHARGIFHRDIKPENLFWYQDRATIGDFGLVDYPEKEAITAETKALGPRFFIADEMISSPSTANGGPADVYSLSKTLWVSLTRQTYPPGGELRVDNGRDRLEEFMPHSRSGELDLLIEQATRREPQRRPTMNELAKQLRAWITELPHRGATMDLSHLRSQVEGIMGPRMREIEHIKRVKARFEERETQLGMSRLKVEQLLRQAGFDPFKGVDNFSTRLVFQPQDDKIKSRCGGSLGVLLRGRNRILACGTASILLDNERVQHGAIYYLCETTKFNFIKELWVMHETTTLGSPEETRVLGAIGDEFVNNLEAAVKALIAS